MVRIFRHVLPDYASSLVCLVRKLLVLAMRVGNVRGTDLDTLLTWASQHNDKYIEWVDPGFPVFAK
jgi:hypothetical protein